MAVLCLGVLIVCSADLHTPALHAQEPQARPAVKLDPEILDDYVGQYDLAPKLQLTLRRGEASSHGPDHRPAAIVVYPGERNHVLLEGRERTVHHPEEQGGGVEGLLFEQGEVKLKARKISNELPQEVELPEPEDVIESPRLVALAKELKKGNRQRPSQSSGTTCRTRAHSLNPLGGENAKVVGDVRLAGRRQDADEFA